MLRRIALVALLVSGCGVPPSAPQPSAQPPRSGPWQLSYAIGGIERQESLELDFHPDHTVTVAGFPPSSADYPSSWGPDHARFEGLPRRDLANPWANGRDRLDLTVVSPVEMRGTVSFRSNLRWLAVPVTARFTPAVAAGDIADEPAAELFD